MKLFRHSRGALKITSMPENSSLMEFITLRDDDERLYLSKKAYNHGDFAFRYAIKAFDMAQYIGKSEVGRESSLHIELYVVSPQAAGRHAINRAIKCCGYEEFPKPGKNKKDREVRNIAICEALLSYGTAAGIYSLIGGHARVFNDGWWEEPEDVDLEEELTEGVELMMSRALFVHSMFGFYMDAPLNAIGATGWDWIKGDITRSKERT